MYNFDCEKDPPQVATRKMIDRKIDGRNFPCLICVYWENESRRVKCGTCNMDERGVHKNCLEFIGGSEEGFQCSKITKLPLIVSIQ